MKLATFKELRKHFDTDEKRFIKDGYYRLRAADERVYELAYLEAGPCGDTTVHPQITLEITNDAVVPLKLLDLSAAPVIRFSREESLEELEQALDLLEARFLQVLSH
ncbi:hypothetical protein ACYSNR_14180 [Enterococcus sp. LJL128]